jgi:hypothetical protein
MKKQHSLFLLIFSFFLFFSFLVHVSQARQAEEEAKWSGIPEWKRSLLSEKVGDSLALSPTLPLSNHVSFCFASLCFGVCVCVCVCEGAEEARGRGTTSRGRAAEARGPGTVQFAAGLEAEAAHREGAAGVKREREKKRIEIINPAVCILEENMSPKFLLVVAIFPLCFYHIN